MDTKAYKKTLKEQCDTSQLSKGSFCLRAKPIFKTFIDPEAFEHYLRAIEEHKGWTPASTGNAFMTLGTAERHRKKLLSDVQDDQRERLLLPSYEMVCLVLDSTVLATPQH